MQKSLAHGNFSFEFNANNTIIIKEKALVITKTTIQERVITGTVKDEAGMPLVGATITIEGTSRGVIADFDGKFEYTDILNIEFEISKVDIRVYPNPASNYIVIENMGVGETVQILSANGQLVKSFQIENNNQQTAIDDLPSGTYFIKVNNQIKRLIISK